MLFNHLPDRWAKPPAGQLIVSLERNKRMNYTLSTDYDKLFDIIKRGEEMVGFVDFQFKSHNGEYVSEKARDVVKIRRLQNRQLDIFCRGTVYDGIDEYIYDEILEEEKDLKEKQWFIAICKRNNLGWIEC